MEAVAQMEETEIMKILFPTIGAFVPLLEYKRQEILAAPKTFQYGEMDRHQLDVYYPSAPPSGTTSKHPILFFLYGGGFVQGARRFPAPVDLAYGNLGTYFAAQGFVTVIPDYRLVPSVVFPAPAEDVRDAIAWVLEHPAELGQADTERVFLLGHSVGGVHALTMLLHPPILAGERGQKVKDAIKGAVLASSPYHFSPAGVLLPNSTTTDAATAYYGSPESTEAYSPLGLLLSSPTPATVLPPLALVSCEKDPTWFTAVGKDWVKATSELVPKPKEIFAKGHNHISITFALGAEDSESGEQWAEEVVVWMNGL
ncbi:Alpha/Beta hydrolase protein [Mycena amicta]|nr:Alpha/Beta hydrolase protein [Mycena amicta]